ncbi:hypothetical protein F8C76_09535 [Flagellimonas olearia]|uniref:Uncharacterized protein n=1 Tax=Flagellimonas olearia TaxID=552546 RepID=A0A6I1DXM8_9FLAO|nr:hypothetical protein [Allomuricauda olearia]KAB7528112.1 hypothetical protein F8C76_09535 [Allomuricauda olearia]
MESISRLNKSIEYLQSVIEELLPLLKSNPDDFALKLQIENYKSEISNLQKSLHDANLKRNKEIIALRLKGNIARFGTFPLESVGGITNSFSNALYKTSQFLQYGKKGGKKIESILKNSLDIRLEGMASGSTIFYISAKTSPDIFGKSLIQNSLENTFELFSSNNEMELMENIEKVGVKNSKYFSKFLDELVKDDLEIELTWESPDYEAREWIGDKDKILMFSNTFKSIEVSEPEILNFQAELITLSLKNKIEIRDIETGQIYSVRYESLFTEILKGFHIGELRDVTMTKTTIINTVSQKEKIEYNLLEI